MPVAVVIGGPTLDKIASMFSFPGVDDWDILGGFYGESAKVVKCETNDLTVPANAEIIMEGRMMTSEGWIYDEGPYGEYTGTYGAGLPKN
jgi:UbiD family decarboxylase